MWGWGGGGEGTKINYLLGPPVCDLDRPLLPSIPGILYCNNPHKQTKKNSYGKYFNRKKKESVPYISEQLVDRERGVFLPLIIILELCLKYPISNDIFITYLSE